MRTITMEARVCRMMIFKTQTSSSPCFRKGFPEDLTEQLCYRGRTPLAWCGCRPCASLYLWRDFVCSDRQFWICSLNARASQARLPPNTPGKHWLYRPKGRRDYGERRSPSWEWVVAAATSSSSSLIWVLERSWLLIPTHTMNRTAIAWCLL